MKLCACKCGQPVRRNDRRFLYGHYWKLKSPAQRRAQARKGVATRKAKGYRMHGAVGYRTEATHGT